MKFVLHEIKLWFKEKEIEPKSYELLPNKVNVITGDSTTGKTSFWSIIDYCLLASKINIANEITNKVHWFGIHFSINEKEISIARKTPENGAVSSDVYFNFGYFSNYPVGNKSIAEVKSILDLEFGITDELRFPFGKDLGATSLNLSYRHFLIFNSITENIIGAQETYFDTTFYGKEEYEKILNHIFSLAIGINDMANIKASERLIEVEKELRKIQKQNKDFQQKNKNFENEIKLLFEKCKANNFIEYSQPFETIDVAIPMIQSVVENTQKAAQNSKLFEELDELNRQKNAIKSQIEAINQYQKEYEIYQGNLNKSADSLQPIEFLNQKLSDQLVDSYETRVFVESLEHSLKNIKETLSKKMIQPIKVEGDVKILKKQIQEIEGKISKLNEIKKNYQTEGEKFIAIGEIKHTLEQILKFDLGKPIDSVSLNTLTDEKENLIKFPSEKEEIEFNLKTALNNSIQRIFDQLKFLPDFIKNSRVKFNSDEMILELVQAGQLFPINNVGSKSNYMYMHLCVYLGLHEHILNVNPEHIPQFLFIDQPSIPYYSGTDTIKRNDDKQKLIDAFTLLNSFIEYIVNEKGKCFQIFMVEHAPKDYWIENKLSHFHTVDEFIDGKGLIPQEAYDIN